MNYPASDRKQVAHCPPSCMILRYLCDKARVSIRHLEGESPSRLYFGTLPSVQLTREALAAASADIFVSY